MASAEDLVNTPMRRSDFLKTAPAAGATAVLAGTLRVFERLIEHIKGYEDVWWATGREINDYWRYRYPADGLPAASGMDAPTKEER
jgi:hypothetical protein